MLGKSVPLCHDPHRKAEAARPLTKGSEDMDEMTSPEPNKYLEAIARLIRTEAKTVEEAAKIVESMMIKA